MNKSRFVSLAVVALLVGAWATSESSIHANNGGENGPDIIVGDLNGITNWGTSEGASSFSIGTTSCNVGDQNLAWLSSTPEHPVSSQSLFRVKNGRIEHLGQSWLKHGVFAVSQDLCGSCDGTGGTALGIGCSSPSSSALAGSQGGLGPMSEVNAATGVFTMPYRELNNTQRGIFGGRIRVENSEISRLQNLGARYFAETHHIQPEDAQAGNGLNNASFREAFVSGNSNNPDVSFQSSTPTRRKKPAILAWQLVHPDVRIFKVDIPNDGRLVVGLRTVENHIEIAIQNLNSHISVRSLKVGFDSAAISNPGFRDVDYHAESYSDADWVPTITGNEIEWATETFAQNPDANALRWSTLYSFWLDADETPTHLTLGMFRPGGPSEMVVDLRPEVFPSSVVVERGDTVGGSASELILSDDTDLSVRRSNQDIQSRTEVEMIGTSPTSSPSSIDVTLESSVFARTPIIQTIDLYNFDSMSWEQISTGVAMRFSDSTTTSSASGDLSRFVATDTNEIRARVVHQSDNNPRQRFTSHHDQFSWVIGM